jgi:mycofactocin precursor
MDVPYVLGATIWRTIQPTLVTNSGQSLQGLFRNHGQTTTITPMEKDLSGAPQDSSDTDTDVDAELLVEEISIDGMCGVY